MEKMEEDVAYKAHVLVISVPFQGHINPLLQLAKRLASKGVKSTIATTTSIAKSIHIEAGSIKVEPISDVLDAFLNESVGSPILAELIEKQGRSRCPFSCLIYDSVLPWTLDVAKARGLSGAAFFTQSSAVDGIYYHMHHGRLTIPSEAATISLPGLPQFEISELPGFVSNSKYAAYLEVVSNQFSNVERADWVLRNTFDKLEEEVLCWMKALWNVKTIGPTLPSMYLDKRIEGDQEYGLNITNSNKEACINWLDSRPIGSVVYVSFGSMATIEAEQMEELATALRETGRFFLWVVRESEDKLPSNFKEETKDIGLVVAWCPQLEVLAHQAIGCFVTHCGWNSTLEALSLGVPVVTVPQWSDQPTNAKYVEEFWRVGVRAKLDDKGIVRREEVKLCIMEVMEGDKAEEFKRNSSKWRDLAKEAVGEGGSTSKNIDEFVASLNSK